MTIRQKDGSFNHAASVVATYIVHQTQTSTPLLTTHVWNVKNHNNQLTQTESSNVALTSQTDEGVQLFFFFFF